MKTLELAKEKFHTNNPRDYRQKTRISIRFFTGVLILAGILLVIIGIGNYRAKQAVNILKERNFHIDQLIGQIIHFDEVLTMSAQMAVATGDIKWETQYHEFEAKLNAAIDQAMILSPGIYRKETVETSIGKIKLLEMESKAFALIRRGSNKEAMNILFGQQYEAKKGGYVAAIQHLNSLLNKQMDAALAVENSKENFSQISFITVFILLLLSWLAILRIARSSEEALVKSNQRLDELNKTLDQKVKDRTDHLMLTLKELQKAHEDLKNVQSQLLQSEKFSAIGQLAAGIAHEINNPIGFINSNLQTLEKYVVHYTQLLGILNKLEKALNDNDQDRVSVIITSWEKIRKETNFKFIEGDISNLIRESITGTESMKKIVADLCAFANPDNEMEVSVNMEALMESMVNIAWNEIKYKAQLRKDYNHVPSIICNPQKLGQVFVNLLTNAAHAIAGKGFITIKTYLKDKFVCIDVSDTGCGIPSENITKIFDPFFTTRPVGKGVGLGLSVSYDIIRRHGGNLTFCSNVDKGTTFTVMMPLEHAL